MVYLEKGYILVPILVIMLLNMNLRYLSFEKILFENLVFQHSEITF